MAAVPPATLASIPNGFRAVVSGQQVIYCRDEAPVARAFAVSCLTAAEIERQRASVSAARESAEMDSLRRAARSAAAASRPGR